MLFASLITDAVAALLHGASQQLGVTKPLWLYEIGICADRCLATYRGTPAWSACGCEFHRRIR